MYMFKFIVLCYFREIFYTKNVWNRSDYFSSKFAIIVWKLILWRKFKCWIILASLIWFVQRILGKRLKANKFSQTIEKIEKVKNFINRFGQFQIISKVTYNNKKFALAYKNFIFSTYSREHGSRDFLINSYISKFSFEEIIYFVTVAQESFEKKMPRHPNFPK